LHIHVAHVLYEQFDFGRSLLLDNVIDQLRYLGSDGFRSATLSYVIGEGHDLWKRMKNDGDINCKANP
jgi:m7GpppX diphosphatase